ncbi:GNAT family N-acetyltransferase [Candidatus Thorarchaeota archaeon]|nr:MAG: GNAT family N-acetyltransferase [Candidatus Thorarchaeota archaeon]
MKIRPMKKGDVSFAVGLATSESWSNTPTDFETLVEYRPTAAFVAEKNGERIGMISAVSYGSFGFIGNLIVKTEYRCQGMGTQLMLHAIAHLEQSGNERILLDAVQEYQSLYENLGFTRFCESLRFRGNITCEERENTKLIQAGEVEHLMSLDRSTFGADRDHFLRNAIQLHHATCRVAVDGGEIIGYCLATPIPNWLRIGPLIVRDDAETAEDLIVTLHEPGRTMAVIVGVLEQNAEAINLYRRLGLQETAPSIRMIRGKEGSRRDYTQEFAIGSPAKG